MKLSIIVPIFNRAAVLGECLSSLKKQRELRIEFILVDDGSTDESGDVCRRYQAEDARFIYFHKENEGAGSARNFGIKKSRGKYLAFVDSDDILHEDFSAVFLEIANQYPNVEIISGRRITSEAFSGFDKINRLFSDVSRIEFINNGTSSCGRIFKSEMVVNSVLYPEKTWAEDNAFIPILASLSKSILYTESPVYWIRPAKLSSNNTSLSERCLQDMPRAMKYLGMHCLDSKMVSFVLFSCVYATYQRLINEDKSISDYDIYYEMQDVFSIFNYHSKISDSMLMLGGELKVRFLFFFFYARGLKVPLQLLLKLSRKK